MQIAKEKKTNFMWLTCTNKGASEVCEAALRANGITDKQLESGYRCDPSSKSNLPIVAVKGVLMRLTRNFDKTRGFVNGALAFVFEPLHGNEVFVAQLLESGNMVLVHPMEENGIKFLPCCYGYATTIRRAKGASLDQGCVYFDQKKRPAGRGYAYVAVSRFRTQGGCHLYGKLRRSDFLPVGEEQSDEHLERGYESLNSSDSEYDGQHYHDQSGFGAPPDASDCGSEYEGYDDLEYGGQGSLNDEIVKNLEEGVCNVALFRGVAFSACTGAFSSWILHEPYCNTKYGL